MIQARASYAALVLCVGLVAPRLALAQCPDGTPPPCSHAARAPAPAPTSLAVLYFDNLSRDSNDLYLADGLTEELIARLTQIPRLSVQSRSAVHRYRGGDLDPRSLGRALNVAYLVTGSVRRGPGRLRVGVSLVRSSTGVGVWADQFDRTDADLLGIQEDIAREVTIRIAGRLLPDERATLASRRTRDPIAYDHFLRGEHFLARRTAPSLAAAVAEYRQALARDPGFADAQARVAYAYALGTSYGVTGEPPESLPSRGFRAAERAVVLDSTSSDAWLAWASLRWQQARRGTRDTAAYGAFQRALRLNPRSGEAYHSQAFALWQDGDTAAAAASFRRALEVEPARPVSLTELAMMRGALDAAGRRLLDSALAVDPEFSLAYAARAQLRLATGDTLGARADASAAWRLGTGFVRDVSARVLRSIYSASGDTAAANALARDLADDAFLTEAIPIEVAGALLQAGDPERALSVLAVRRRRVSRSECLGLTASWWVPVRDDPRFRTELDRLCPR